MLPVDWQDWLYQVSQQEARDSTFEAATSVIRRYDSHFNNTRKLNERAWKLRALRYALLLSSSCMLLELMEIFPGTGADSADHGRSGVDGISQRRFLWWRWLARSRLFWRRRDLSSKVCFCWRILSPIRQLASILIPFPPRLPISFQKVSLYIRESYT